MLRQGLTHFFNQQAIAPVGAHSQQQCAIEHVLQRCFIAAYGQLKIAPVKLQAVVLGFKCGGSIE
jgi:acyl-CoA synthetase (NDP forming)